MAQRGALGSPRKSPISDSGECIWFQHVNFFLLDITDLSGNVSSGFLVDYHVLLEANMSTEAGLIVLDILNLMSNTYRVFIYFTSHRFIYSHLNNIILLNFASF